MRKRNKNNGHKILDVEVEEKSAVLKIYYHPENKETPVTGVWSKKMADGSTFQKDAGGLCAYFDVIKNVGQWHEDTVFELKCKASDPQYKKATDSKGWEEILDDNLRVKKCLRKNVTKYFCTLLINAQQHGIANASTTGRVHLNIDMHVNTVRILSDGMISRAFSVKGKFKEPHKEKSSEYETIRRPIPKTFLLGVIDLSI